MTEVLTRTISPARMTAFGTLEAVARGSYASDFLRDGCRALDPRDAALASQIVFGCLRFQGQLDFLVSLYSGRKLRQIQPALLVVLRMAIFQLRHLQRVPAHAVVNDAVQLAKRQGRAAAGFANAVLRKVNRNPVRWPNLESELSCPAWLINRWESHFGTEQARAIAAAALNEPSAYIRIPPPSPPPASWETEPTHVPGCYRLISSRDKGLRLHDISSQAILPLLDLRPGDTYLDLCAAPGNKTLQALETPLSLAVAGDISPKRILDIPPICPRVVLDGSRPLPFGIRFDRIFIDAPCSGTGTLARNPEIKWRVQEQDLRRFKAKQKAILSEALKHLAVGGKLLYATCSLEKEENEDVVGETLRCRPRLKCGTELWRLPGRDEGDGFYAAVLS